MHMLVLFVCMYSLCFIQSGFEFFYEAFFSSI